MNLDRDRRHSPIPLAWMNEAQARSERRLAGAQVQIASEHVRAAAARGDLEARAAALRWMFDALALWAEFMTREEDA